MKDEYVYIDYPYLSKSSINQYLKCKYAFKRRIIDGVNYGKSTAAIRGSILHLFFHNFFDAISFDTLMELNWQKMAGTTSSRVYMYFLSTLMSFLEGEEPTKLIYHNFMNFAMLQENRWVYLRRTYKKPTTLKKYFFPLEREKFYRNNDLKIFGTIDAVYLSEEAIIIVDYKTGKVPYNVKNGDYNGMYLKNSIGDYSREGNFYVLLYMLNHGYKIKDGVLYNEKGEKFNRNIIDYAFVFTGDYGEHVNYYIARKKTSTLSIRKLTELIEKIRDTTEYPRNLNEYICPYCQFYNTECHGLIPDDVYRDIFGSEDTTSENILKRRKRYF